MNTLFQCPVCNCVFGLTDAELEQLRSDPNKVLLKTCPNLDYKVVVKITPNLGEDNTATLLVEKINVPTHVELKNVMVKNGKIENVEVFVAQSFSQKEYFRMCVLHKSFFIDDVWFFLPNGHMKAREVGGREIWLSDIVYRGFGWTDEDGQYYPIDCFTVHPKERLEKWT